MTGKYRTIVADPPWPVRAKRSGVGHLARATALPYETMTVDAIERMPVERMASRDAALYLWTVQSMIREAYGVADSWGFRPTAMLVWSKAPRGVTRADYVCSAEFVLYCKCGQPARLEQQMGTVFGWPRGEHSAKPDAFLDMVERVNPGPYLEMFARRARFGWDYAGDESLGTAEMPEAAA